MREEQQVRSVLGSGTMCPRESRWQSPEKQECEGWDTILQEQTLHTSDHKHKPKKSGFELSRLNLSYSSTNDWSL